jgi:hypothetical protein
MENETKKYYLTVKGKRVMVGELNENKVFIKCVKSSKHYLIKADGYSIASETVRQLKDDGCKKIVLYDIDKDEKWKVSFDVFMKKGWDNEWGGYEKQRVLNKKWWDIYDVGDELGDDMVLKQKGQELEQEEINIEDRQLKLF